jgi:GAF domain
MSDFEQLQEILGAKPCTPARVCGEIATLFGVRPTEVGLLAVEDEFLTFLFPVELQAAGLIPLTSSAVAARTASNRTSLLFNRFPMVPHHTIFEQIKLNDAHPLSELPDPIQKLMSAPIMDEDSRVIGVVQVCRKGMTPGIAGGDFTDEDLHRLERVAREIATAIPEMQLPPLGGRRDPLGYLPKPNKRASA